ADFEKMANLTEELICYLAEKVCGSLTIEHRDSEEKVVRTINLKRPWRRARYHDLVREVAGQDWFELSREQRRDRATNQFKLEILLQLADYEVTQHVFEKLIEEKTIDPLFVTHCPKELVPLAKQNAADDSLVDVFELIINGAEIAPGYSELKDPLVQRQRLQESPGSAAFQIKSDFCVDAIVCDFAIIHFSGEFLDVNRANVPKCLRGFLYSALRGILPALRRL